MQVTRTRFGQGVGRPHASWWVLAVLALVGGTAIARQSDAPVLLLVATGLVGFLLALAAVWTPRPQSSASVVGLGGMLLLGQQDILMHSAPLVAFKISNFTSYGYSCMPDKVPVDRKLSFPVASNLYKDSEELLRNLHMAPYTKPILSLIDDFPIYQRHKGWQFGYLINDTSKQV